MENKVIHKVFLLGFIVVLFLYATTSNGQNGTLSSAMKAMEQGNTSSLVSLFDSSVEISVNGSKKSYKPEEAKEVLSSFFSKNPSTGFKHVHEGSSSNGMQYAIGKYLHSGGSFKVYILVKGNKITLLDIGNG